MIKMKQILQMLVALVTFATLVFPYSTKTEASVVTEYDVRSRETINKDGGTGINLSAFYNRFGRTATSGQSGRYDGPGGM